jgi:hypothetical protein
VNPSSRHIQTVRRAKAVAIARARPTVDAASITLVAVLSLLLSVAAWMYAT